MKLSDKTLSILKSFTHISPHLVVRKGNVVKTMAPTKTILAKTELDQDFPSNFAIYDLNRLINGVGLQKDPEIKFENDHLVIFSNDGTSKIYFSDVDLIIGSNKNMDPYREIKLPSVDVAFNLSKDRLGTIKKAAGIFGVEDIVVEGKDGTITLKAVDVNNPTSHSHEIEVGDTDKTFLAVFKVENFNKPLDRDYHVEISSAGFAHLTADDIEYYVALDSESSRF